MFSLGSIEFKNSWIILDMHKNWETYKTRKVTYCISKLCKFTSVFAISQTDIHFPVAVPIFSLKVKECITISPLTSKMMYDFAATFAKQML